MSMAICCPRSLTEPHTIAQICWLGLQSFCLSVSQDYVLYLWKCISSEQVFEFCLGLQPCISSRKAYFPVYKLCMFFGVGCVFDILRKMFEGTCWLQLGFLIFSWNMDTIKNMTNIWRKANVSVMHPLLPNNSVLCVYSCPALKPNL